MTMPDERMRALRWAHELLRELPSDPELPEALSAQGKILASSFPSQDDLAQLLITFDSARAACYANAIESVGELFQMIQAAPGASQQTRRALLYTLRHYPLGHHACSALRLGGEALDQWIDLE